MKLSVIIVNYNVKYFLEQALLSVRKSIEYLALHHPAWKVDVWVVDNNSSDDSIEMVASKFPEVKRIANKENTGFSYANNQAIKESTAEYVLLLNPDTVIPEDCLLKTVTFMDEHPDAGGLGVKMLDGGGEFLPESKRGFPSPQVAFFKIFGISKFFPNSKKFGQYHLSYLSKDETHSVDVLAGAFMLLRRSVLDKIGFLDEDFFMYGEDIDLSYRIIKAGYKNYYYPFSEIIHYKGESTKRSSVNYVFVFYRAMVIFAKKHLPKQSAALFAVFINLAIYLRAGIAILFRFLKQITLPALDFGVLYILMFLLVRYWEHTIKYIHGGEYPDVLLNTFVPIYILFWITGLFFGRGYQKPFQLKKVIKGVLIGTLLLTVFYAFLPENYRFSRALLILGAGMAVVAFMLNRIGIIFLKRRKWNFETAVSKRIIIVADIMECNRVRALLEKVKLDYNFIGRLATQENIQSDSDQLGTLEDLNRIVNIYKPDELIFCSKNVPYHTSIYWIKTLSGKNIDFKLVPENSDFVIGSNSKNEKGDYYTLSHQPIIVQKESKFNKRIFDILASLVLLIFYPIDLWMVRNPFQFLKNIFKVLQGKRSWVGFSLHEEHEKQIKIKKGILNPADELNDSQKIDLNTVKRLDYLYARDYSVYKDLSIILNGFSKLGKK